MLAVYRRSPPLVKNRKKELSSPEFYLREGERLYTG